MNNMMEEIEAFMRLSGVSVFGITGTDCLEDEPKGYRPSDLLQASKSMLCLGIPIPRGVFKSKERVNKNYWRSASLYYRKIDTIIMQVAEIIEKYNETATPAFS